MLSWEKVSEIDFVKSDILKEKNITLAVLREDLLHKTLSGNKFRKLQYFYQTLVKENKKGLLSFGGAHSNHIYALAHLGNILKIPTIGYIRGEEWRGKLGASPTLSTAKKLGMQLVFLSREVYREKNKEEFLISLKQKHPKFLIVPEGGDSILGFEGCKNILNKKTKDFDFICAPIGTGTTISGILDSKQNKQKCLGFPAIKNPDYLLENIKEYTNVKDLKLIKDYSFGGFGKLKPELVGFMNSFYKNHFIMLDPIYTSKMFYGIFDMLEKGFFKQNTKVLAIHTGGLQGIEAANLFLNKKNWKTIDYK